MYWLSVANSLSSMMACGHTMFPNKLKCLNNGIICRIWSRIWLRSHNWFLFKLKKIKMKWIHQHYFKYNFPVHYFLISLYYTYHMCTCTYLRVSNTCRYGKQCLSVIPQLSRTKVWRPNRSSKGFKLWSSRQKLRSNSQRLDPNCPITFRLEVGKGNKEPIDEKKYSQLDKYSN